mgnify:FL=1|jgi:hypothetical protein
MGKYIKPQLLEKAKSIDLVTYFRTYMPSELVRASTNEYTTKSHDSLRMSNGLWNWCSRGFGGKNAIDFIMKTKNMRFIDAANLLLDQMNLKQPIVIDKTIKSKEKHIIIPEKNSASNNVFLYLKSRGIDEEIIKKCIEKNLIYEEKYYHNAVFVGYDELGNIRYAGCRSTNEKVFKADATGSDKSYSFRLESTTKTDTIYIFEGAIDALSYATLFKIYGQNYEEKTLISLAGVYQPASNISQSKVPIAIQKYLEKHPETRRIYLCLDNDEAGKNASKALENVLSHKYEVIIKPPKKRQRL